MKTSLASLMLILLSLSGPVFAMDSKPVVLFRIGDVPVELREGDKFAVMLVNDGGEDDPSPRYILALAESRTVLDTKDRSLFKSVLSKTPKGTTIFEYDSCTVPRSWGLKKSQIEAYKALFKELGLKVSEDPRITCYCESLGK
jgi:hypothetical protein